MNLHTKYIKYTNEYVYKNHTDWKERKQLSYADDMMVYTENPKKSSKKNLVSQVLPQKS